MKKFIQEFKDFIMRGNVVDMAVGVIVGSALTSIVNSLVNNIINPFIVFLTGGQTTISGLVVPGTHIDFGAFLSSIINFLIVAFIVFLLVKGISTLKKAGGEFHLTKSLKQLYVVLCATKKLIKRHYVVLIARKTSKIEKKLSKQNK